MISICTPLNIEENLEHPPPPLTIVLSALFVKNVRFPRLSDDPAFERSGSILRLKAAFEGLIEPIRGFM